VPLSLTLNGVEIPCKSGGLLEPSRYGESVRQYNNRLRSDEEPDFRTRRWQFTTKPLTYAEWVAIYPLLTSVGILSADGYAITRSGGPVFVLAELGDVPNSWKDPTDVEYVATFTLYERGGATSAGVTTDIYLSATLDTTYDDGAGGVYYIATIGAPYPGEYPSSGFATGPAQPPDQVPSGDVVTLTRSWITPRMNPAVVDGIARLIAEGIGINPWNTWAKQRLTITTSLIRAAAPVAGPHAFTSSAVHFSGGPITAQTVSPIVGLAVLADDRLRIDSYTIINMWPGGGEDGFRPGMGHGGTSARVIMPGTLTEAP
jgi:hypothetical protein